MSENVPRKRPAYGAIFRTGEYVQRGDILGLSTDGLMTVKAPMSGWVRLPSTAEVGMEDSPLAVEIWRRPDYSGETCCLKIAS
jgi:hypothetical protein